MSRSENLIHWCLVAFVLVCAGLLLQRLFAPTDHPGAGVDQALSGRPLDVPGVNWNKHRLNVAVYLGTHCGFCRKSMPFYRRLADARLEAGAALAVISLEPPPTVQEFLASFNVSADSVRQITKPIGLTGTPTLLIIDSGGIVHKAWRGVLAAEQEKEILTIMRQGHT